MLFNSYVFLVFFPIVLLMYFILPVKIKNYWLLVASYYFYMSWNPKYGLLLLGCTLVSYFSARLVSKAEDTGKKKMILAGTLIDKIPNLFGLEYGPLEEADLDIRVRIYVYDCVSGEELAILDY